MRKGTPNQFIAELEDRIEKLKGEDVESSVEVIDDGEDVIQAECDSKSEVTSSIKEESISEVDSDDYLKGLYSEVEDELADLLEEVSWSSDDENIYMDVSFEDGHVFTFTIPKADLVYDIENQSTDVEYICRAVRDSEDATEDSFDDVPPEDANYDMSDYYSEEDKPVYL